ncbi:hypothetical protein QCA50_020076 [Cerrena zonata]|uniref:Uncharacterized protein n=1 Tax=Cerrena zonata TaxID=2478898 RepID=A0AAW0F8J0_9APHY
MVSPLGCGTTSNAKTLRSTRPKSAGPLANSWNTNRTSVSVSCTSSDSGSRRKSLLVARKPYVSPLVNRSSLRPLGAPSSDDDNYDSANSSSSTLADSIPLKHPAATSKSKSTTKSASPPIAKVYCDRAVQTEMVEKTLIPASVTSTSIAPLPILAPTTVAALGRILGLTSTFVPSPVLSPTLGASSHDNITTIPTASIRPSEAKVKAWLFHQQNEFLATKQRVITELKFGSNRTGAKKIPAKTIEELPAPSIKRPKNKRYSLPNIQTSQVPSLPSRAKTISFRTPITTTNMTTFLIVRSIPTPVPTQISTPITTGSSESPIRNLNELTQARTTAEEVRARLKLGLTLCPLPEEEKERVSEKGWYKELQMARRASMKSKRYSII